jgi:hypothetical protein
VSLLLRSGFQIFRQGIELGFPEGAVLPDPGGSVFHGIGGQVAAMDAPVDFAAQQARRFQHAQMLGNRGQRHFKWLGQLRHGGFAASQARNDGTPRGIGERAKGGIQLRREMVNHTV